MADASSISFRLPSEQVIEVYAVRLGDGRVVVRTAEELLLLPAGAAPATPAPPVQK